MHIDTTSHEHGASGKVYSYAADYQIVGNSIRWHADVTQAGASARRFSGSIPLTSPAVSTLAEQAVRDAILSCIDRFDDAQAGLPASNAGDIDG